MNEEVKIKFLDALLSGLYEQVAGQMRSADGKVCANGVLCELAIQEHVIGILHNDKRWTQSSATNTTSSPTCLDGYWTYGLSEFGLSGLSENWKNDYPPKSVLKWAGVTYEWAHQLAHLNDNGRSFEDIAEIIKNGGLPEGGESNE